MNATTKLSDYLGEWLATAVKSNVEFGTYISYESNIRNHINPAIGETRLCDLTVIKLQRFANDLCCSGDTTLSTASARLVMSVLNNALDFAEICGYITSNPCKKVRKRRVRQKEVEVFTRVEQKNIEDCIWASDDSRLLGVVISLYAGLRLGEVCALKWSDLDKENCRLNVRATMKRVEERESSGSVSSSQTKTPQSVRAVPIPNFLVEKLFQARMNSESEFILSHNGKFVNPRTLQELYRKLLKTATVQYKNFHVCRHTFATRAIELGIDIKTVSICLGHTNSNITINR